TGRRAGWWRRASGSRRKWTRWHGPTFFSSRRRHTRCLSDWSSDVCSSDLPGSKNQIGIASRVVRVQMRQEYGSQFDAAETERRQIGRASCRERVKISEGGGSLKKNETQRTGAA